MQEFSEEAETAEEVLNSREKYNVILPMLLNIASIAWSHGTDQFNSYLNSMKETESRVRAGKEITSMHGGNNGGGVVEKENRDECETEISTPTQDNISVPSKFQNLQFKTKVKVQGRPKRSDHQLCAFNKSVADRTATSGKPKLRKQKTKSTQEGGPTQPKKRRRDEECIVCKNTLDDDTIITGSARGLHH